MKSSLGISYFLEEISSLSHSIVFLYFLCIAHIRRLSYLSLLFFRTLYADEYIFPFLLCLLLPFFSQLFVSPLRQSFCLLAFCLLGDGFGHCYEWWPVLKVNQRVKGEFGDRNHRNQTVGWFLQQRQFSYATNHTGCLWSRVPDSPGMECQYGLLSCHLFRSVWAVSGEKWDGFLDREHRSLQAAGAPQWATWTGSEVGEPQRS